MDCTTILLLCNKNFFLKPQSFANIKKKNLTKDRALGKHILQDEDEEQNGSERPAGLATAAADLDQHDVTPSQRDDKSSDIRHDRQTIVSDREMAKPDT